jgi:hypothetical protein
MTGYNQDIYTEAYNVRPGDPNGTGQRWKDAPASAAPANPAPPGLSPRAKAAIGAGAAVLVVTGAFAWTSYADSQARADVQKAQIALEQQRLDLQKEQQAAQLAAEQAKTAGQETEAQKARRLAVSDCVAKASGNFNAIADCGNAFPLVESLGGMQTASQTVSHGTNSGPVPLPAVIVLGGVAVAFGVGWARKHLPRL